jgi:hypothetical protein
LRCWRPIAVAVIALCLLGGCGGGGGGPAGPTYAVLKVTPSIIYGERAESLRLEGNGFITGGGTRRVVLQAASGSPFANGTSATLSVSGDPVSNEFVDCDVPATGVAGSFQAYVSVELDDGSLISSPSPILQVRAQRVAGVTPGTVDGSRPVAFTITGEGFASTASTAATVRFEATGGALFHPGLASGGSISAVGSIDSDTQISGVIPYMGIDAAAPCRVFVTLSDGTLIKAPVGVTVLVEPGPDGVRGTWTYERPLSTASGLDLTSISEHPIRGAVAQLVRSANGTVITQRTLDAAGAYQMHYGPGESVFVRVLSMTGSGAPPIRVEDNTSGDALYAAEGAPFVIGSGIETRDYVATTGWDGASYAGPRTAAPFAVMDVAYEAMSQFLAERSITFPTCVLNWSSENRPSTTYDVTTGEIGGAHFDGQEIFLSGKEDVDTDEFDPFVIAHEWGHYFEAALSRTDTIAGPHSFGYDWLDMTVSFSEGWGTAIAAAIHEPDAVYRDSMGVGQAMGWGEDVEDNSLDGGAFYPNTGWFSESSVFWILYDIMDSDNESPHDTVTLGLGPIYDAFAGAHKDTPYATSIFSFLAALKSANPGSASGIDALCALHGIDAVQDASGTGESNDAGWGPNLPLYHGSSIGGGSVFATLYNAYPYNWVDSNRRFTFTGNTADVTVDVLAPAPVTYLDDFDVAVSVYHNGTLVAFVDDYYDYGEVVTVPSTKGGELYVVLVTDVSPGADPFVYDVDVLITSP